MFRVGSTNDHLGIDPACVRQALRDWSSLKCLGENPAAKTELVSQHQEKSGYSDTCAGRGLALREVLQEALAALQPEPAAPVLEDKRWRPYLILSEQFQKGRSPDWLCEQFHISRATYYLEQQRALEMLTGVLQSRQEKAAAEQAQRRPTLWDFRPASHAQVFMAPPRAAQPLLGREELIDTLKRSLFDRRAARAAALHGLPGSGKTSLAVELAYDPAVRKEFADGVLWAGLGQHPNLTALMGAWAAELGIPADAAASRSGLEERAAMIRAAIGLRRFLIVIDDAWQIDAAFGLKAGGPNCAYLLTTRHASLAVEFAGTRAFRIEELGREDGMALLKWFAPAAFAANPQAAEDLVVSVGALPLALVLMGSYLQVQSAHDQPRRIQQALEFLRQRQAYYQLQRSQSPLEAHPGLPPGEPESLQAVIGLSEAALPPGAQQVFHGLALFPSKPNTFSEQAALAVCACSTADLDTLVDSGLLEPVLDDRYRMHQAISDYARQKAPGAEAVKRMVNFYLAWAAAAPNSLAKLDLEISNIAESCRLAFQQGIHAEAIRLVTVFFAFLEVRGLYDLAGSLLEDALSAAASRDDLETQADILLKMGDIEVRRGQFCSASSHLEQAVSISHEKGLREMEARGVFHLGMAKLYAGEISLGFAVLNQALALARQVEDALLQCFDLNGLGFACQETAQFGAARAYLKEALDLAQNEHLPRGLGWAHQNRCMLEIQSGQYELARDDSRACVQVYQAIGDRRGTAWQMYHEGRIDRHWGDYDSAALRFETALRQLEELGDGMGEGFCLHNLGLLKAERGEWLSAWEDYRNAQRIFESIGCQSGIAQCLHSLALLQRKSGSPRAAIPLLERAMEMREQISFRRGVGVSLGIYALCLYESGRLIPAFECAERAVALFRRLEIPANLASALVYWGRMQMECGNPVEAASVFKEALQVRLEIHQPHLLLEPQAGLAASALLQGRRELAWQACEDAWLTFNKLQAGGLQVMDHPGWVCLHLGKTMRALGFVERAQAVWQWGKKAIREQAERLPPDADAATYLKKNVENRVLLAL